MRPFALVGGFPRAVSRWWRNLSPPALFVVSFVVLIATGTAGLLVLPGLYTGPRLGALDATFTITSAVCVTGLIRVDTATFFTFWGQAWIVLFIQLGGLGLITLTTLMIGALGRRLSLRSEMITLPASGMRPEEGIVAVARQVVRFTLLAEGVGAAILFVTFFPHFPWYRALWHAVFQAVSAFCNAGFSTFSDSMVGWQHNPIVLLTVSGLIISGGLGFLSVEEVRRYFRRRHRHRRLRLSSHTRAVLWTTGLLLVGATVFYSIFEWHGVLSGMSIPTKITNAWFMAATPRTAGFNSVPYNQIGNDTAYFTILLMMVGGSPGSTAGGVKTTTMAVLVALSLSRILGRRHTELYGRTIPEETIERTVGLTLLAFVVVTVAVFTLNTVEASHIHPQLTRGDFLPLMFEAVSAFATCGLSMGVTARLQPASVMILIALMFLGRVGLLSFFTAVSLKRPHIARVRPAREDVMIG